MGVELLSADGLFRLIVKDGVATTFERHNTNVNWVCTGKYRTK